MPNEWEEGTIITINKKGVKQVCNNYRRISLLNTCFETIRIIEGQINHAIHITKQTMEKAQEHKIELDMSFVHFDQVFYSIKKKELITALKC